MNLSFSPKILAAGVVAVVVLVFVGGWYGLVSPQNSKAKTLDKQITAERAELTVARMLARSQRAAKGQVSGVGLLTTAMPSELQMPSILRQVERLAALSNVNLDTFTPSSASTPMNGYNAIPIDTTVTGRYASIQHFLNRLRLQAGASRGRIHASGRLFDVQTVALTPGEAPQLTATIRLTTFVYTGTPLAPTPSGESADSTDSTNGTAASAAPAEEGSSS